MPSIKEQKPRIKITNWSDEDNLEITLNNNPATDLLAGESKHFEIKAGDKLKLVGAGDDIAVEIENETDHHQFSYHEDDQHEEMLDHWESDCIDLDAGITLHIRLHQPTEE